MCNNADLHDFLFTEIGAHDNEVFALMLLDTYHRFIEYVELFHGSVDGASIYPREVVGADAMTVRDRRRRLAEA